ncbi:DUF3592 domain-containing protein [Streptomyces bambusae]|uniref:DUF3592 domain-containing protein n=1 Tax=Streptomyces bambusae TaxID=1550616 RepID=UPI001CFFC650|nr:DUF3592 domain-containing protein [Streptomyces bambusae]MCB5169710.1 DUF3592 domain-containing protein [Streptomyces bambusae]
MLDISESAGAFGLVFGLVGLLFAAVGVTMAVVLVRRLMLRSRTLARGLTAEARCLDTYVTHHRREEGPGTRSRRHVVLGFRTRDGQDVRVEDLSGVPRVVGDFVQVRYLPEHPQRAVALGPGAPGAAVGAVLGVVFSAVFACVGLFFASVGLGLGFMGVGTSELPDGSTEVFTETVTSP